MLKPRPNLCLLAGVHTEGRGSYHLPDSCCGVSIVDLVSPAGPHMQLMGKTPPAGLLL